MPVKKTVPLLFIFSFVFLVTTAQQVTKMNYSLLKKMSNTRLADREIAVFVKGDVEQIKNNVENLGGVFKYAAGNIAAVRLPLSKIPRLASLGSVQRIECNDMKLQPMNDQMVIKNHILEVQNGFGLPQSYNGEHVVAGIIDEGIDFTHPDFRDEFGRTRIKYLWDQTITNFDSATQAHPYGYGKEYIGNQIDTSTQHFDSPFSHGSHVAGIAAGGGLAVNNYKGVAPKADLVIVKMNLNQPDNDFLSSLVDAVKYIFDRADDLGEPAVINISLGTYYGSHDGRDIQAQAIDNLITAEPGRAVVCSAGNAGTAPIHLGYNVTPDTSFTWMQFSSLSMYIQLWGDTADFEGVNYSIAAERVKPGYSTLGRIPFSNVLAHPGVIHYDTIYNDTNRIAIVGSFAQYWNGNYSVELEVFPDSVMNINGPDTSRYFYELLTTGTGRLDAWSFDMVFDNLPDSTVYPAISRYKTPDRDQTIVSSFSCSDKVITVGSYINRNFYTNVNYAVTRDTTLQPGALSTFSSHGPTRDGRIKPDITATGEWLLSCGTQSELNILSATEPDKVAAGKKHKRSSGTSMSSPVVAGIGVLYFQKNPGATWQDFKTALLNCAQTDNWTGTSLPDNAWGYGKADGYGVVKGCNVGIGEPGDYDYIDFAVYPNPLSATSVLYYDLNAMGAFKKAEISVYNIIGSRIKTLLLQDRENTVAVKKWDLAPGIYFCSLVIDGKPVKSLKLIAE
ncbi:MAG: S8 family serine peptidase [Bacteroidia bacterium]|nr:S8 family serine peptidase [Bacteroidia bacterium]